MMVRVPVAAAGKFRMAGFISRLLAELSTGGR